MTDYFEDIKEQKNVLNINALLAEEFLRKKCFIQEL